LRGASIISPLDVYVLNKVLETKLITAGFDQQILSSLTEREVLEYMVALVVLAELEAEQMEKQVKK
jgi:hypothetical protein